MPTRSRRHALPQLLAGLLFLCAPFASGGLVYHVPFEDAEGHRSLANRGTAGGSVQVDTQRKGSTIPQPSYTADAPLAGLAAELEAGSPLGGPVFVLPESTRHFKLDDTGQAITAAAWLRLNPETGKPRDRSIVSKLGGGGLWYLFVNNGHLVFQFKPAAHPGTRWGQRSTDALPVQRWIHVAMVLDTSGAGSGRGIRFYVNGRRFAATGSPGAPMVPPEAPVVIGGYNTQNGGNLNGAVDDVRIYDRALDAGTVAKLAQTTPSRTTGAVKSPSSTRAPEATAAVGRTGVNALDFGAAGDGSTDDTAALQAALDAAAKRGSPGILFIPHGNYLVSKTLTLENTGGLIVRGAGGGGFGVPYQRTRPRTTKTNLIWTGRDGGTLLQTRWCGSNTYENLTFCGRDWRAKDRGAPRAGILMHVVSRKGGGNMMNRMCGVSFLDAEVGIQMGRPEYHNNDSDVYFEFITFRNLDSAFRTTHLQAVNYQFDWVFGLSCGTVFEFLEGGNVQVNNAQLTACELAVDIRGGDKNSGTYLFNNMRCEARRRGTEKDTPGRWQILQAYPREQAVIRFTNFDDVQWYFGKYSAEEKAIPLLEVGPAATVVCETSIFSGTIASVVGTAEKPGVLELINCTLNNIGLPEALAANEHGYFRAVRCRGHNGGRLFDDLVKWPRTATRQLPADKPYSGAYLEAPQLDEQETAE